MRRRLKYSGVRAEPGVVLRELHVGGHRLLLGDVDGSVAVEVVAGEVGEGAYDFREIALQPGDTVLDVGAHIGVVSIYLAKQNPGINILAFEPVPRVFELLTANLRRNRVHNVTAFSLAVTADGRDIELVSHPGSNTGGGTAFVEQLDLAEHERVTVPSTTLDRIMDEHHIERCPLLKIDIEGGEYEVLYGAECLPRIANVRGEFHENRYLLGRGYTMDALLEHCDTVIGPGRTHFTRCFMPDV